MNDETINKLLKDIIFEIEYAQEDYANLEWISKKQAIKIIKYFIIKRQLSEAKE